MIVVEPDELLTSIPPLNAFELVTESEVTSVAALPKLLTEIPSDEPLMVLLASVTLPVARTVMPPSTMFPLDTVTSRPDAKIWPPEMLLLAMLIIFPLAKIAFPKFNLI